MPRLFVKESLFILEQGRRRSMEDSIYPAPGTSLKHSPIYIVCDGVGGSPQGEVASRIVASRAAAYLQGQLRTQMPITSLPKMHSSLCMQLRLSPEINHQNAGTTLAGICIQEESILAYWCGDSRVYHFRDGKLLYRTRDHNVREDWLAENDGEKPFTGSPALAHQLTRNISGEGGGQKIDTAVWSDVAEGDHVLICTDGVYGAWPDGSEDAELGQIFAENTTLEGAEMGIRAGCMEHSRDNYSAWLLTIGKLAE